MLLETGGAVARGQNCHSVQALNDTIRKQFPRVFTARSSQNEGTSVHPSKSSSSHKPEAAFLSYCIVWDASESESRLKQATAVWTLGFVLYAGDTAQQLRNDHVMMYSHCPLVTNGHAVTWINVKFCTCSYRSNASLLGHGTHNEAIVLKPQGPQLQTHDAREPTADVTRCANNSVTRLATMACW